MYGSEGIGLSGHQDIWISRHVDLTMARLVIALANRKGGTGKTTSAAYLAAVLYWNGRTVLGIDADPESSWLKMSRAGLLPYDVVAGERDRLVDLVDAAPDVVVIDTPPNDEGMIYLAGGLADEVIVPVAPTGFDVGRLFSTVATVANIERMRGKAIGSVLLTRYRGHLKIAQECVAELEARGMPVLESRIRQLTVYERFAQPTYLVEYEAVLRELEVT